MVYVTVSDTGAVPVTVITAWKNDDTAILLPHAHFIPSTIVRHFCPTLISSLPSLHDTSAPRSFLPFHHCTTLLPHTHFLGLMDFFGDAFPDRPKRDLLLYASVLLPPSVVAIYDPNIFRGALDLAGEQLVRNPLETHFKRVLSAFQAHFTHVSSVF